LAGHLIAPLEFGCVVNILLAREH